MEDLKDRVRKFRLAKGLRPHELDSLAGLGIGYTYKLETQQDSYTNPTQKTINALAKALDVHPQDLQYKSLHKEPRPYPKKEIKNESIKKEKTLIPVGLYEVPLIMGPVSAGNFEKAFAEWDGETFLISNPTNKNMVAWKIKGQSMQPEYNDGDIIIVDRSIQWKDGNDVIARKNGDEITIKKLKIFKDGSIELRPYNQEYSTINFKDGDEVEILGVVIRQEIDKLRKHK